LLNIKKNLIYEFVAVYFCELPKEELGWIEVTSLKQLLTYKTYTGQGFLT
jgi:hypothetical protein